MAATLSPLIQPRSNAPARVRTGDRCRDEAINAIETQESFTPYPYYSRVQFVATRSGASGAFIFTRTAGANNNGIRAFSYGQQQDKQAAGYTTAQGLGTLADTNLMDGYSTISGERVYIRGIALQWMPCAMYLAAGETTRSRLRMADSLFLAALHERVSVELSLNGGKQSFPLGTIGMLPGAGGLTGGSQQQAGLAALDMNPMVNVQHPTNGWAVRSNFFRVPEGLMWNPQGQADSMLAIIFRQQGDLIVPAGGSEENIALAVTLAATANVTRGYNYPIEMAAELQTFLIGSVVAPRTRSA